MDYANTDDIGAWADSAMMRDPDFTIGPPSDPYLRRWWVVPRNKLANVYLHEILRSDDDRALHDHPWANTSLVISGRYFEHLADGSRHERTAGWVGARQATDAHRLEVLPGERAVTLFMTGPIVREWGFLCPQGWRHWKEFTNAADKGLVGPGCG